jgi:uncharacterized membrane protein HdeD (DUF308 family)
VFGLLTLAWPDVTLWALVLLFGAWAFVDGVFRLMALATGVPGAREHPTALILQGILGIDVGIVTFFWPDMTASPCCSSSPRGRSSSAPSRLPPPSSCAR